MYILIKIKKIKLNCCLKVNMQLRAIDNLKNKGSKSHFETSYVFLTNETNNYVCITCFLLSFMVLAH